MISLIVAYSKNRVIGFNGKIPWKIKGEQSRFRDLTTGNIVVMGRKTFEEIGKPLPNRLTIVISNTKNFNFENCKTAHSLAEAIKMAGNKDIFISGGQKLYEEALPLVKKMYITEVEFECEGDTFFPLFDESLFSKQTEGYFDENIPYTYLTYTRK